MPRSIASCVASRMRTGTPKSANAMAMPPPIVPAPITAAVLISRTFVAGSSPGTRAASRSLKNT